MAAIARRMLRDRDDVDDVVQETFLIAFEQLGRLEEPGALRGWIARIAVSRAHRRFRRRSLAPIDPTADVDRQIAGGASPEDGAELALLDRAGALPREWILRHGCGERLDEVARACACSLATVKRRLAETETQLARHVRPDAATRAPVRGSRS